MSTSFVRSFALFTAVACFGVGVFARQDSDAAKLKNPVAASADSLAAGKKTYLANGCGGCHGTNAEGADKAGIVISQIEDQGGKQPPALDDATWDHGSTDGEIFTTISKGVSGTLMVPWKGRISDQDIWNLVNYLRSLQKK